MKHGRRAPAEFDDAVELWARQWGRHGRVEWNEHTRGWCIHLTKKSDDPSMRLYQMGMLDHEPTESIPVTSYVRGRGHVTVGLDELGVDGLIAILDEGNVWSGRGAHGSLDDSMQATRDRNEKLRHDNRENQAEAGKEMAAKSRRKVFGLPLVPVTTSLNTPTGDTE